MNRKVVIVGALIAMGFSGYQIWSKTTTKEVKVSKIQMGTLSSSILYAGVVAPGEVVPVYIEAPALIEAIDASVGQEVFPGDKLMTFSSKTILENDKELRINELDIKDVTLQIADLEGGSLKLELDNKNLEIKNLEENIKSDERSLPVLAAEARTLTEKAEAFKNLLKADGVSSTETNRAITEADRKNVELEDLKTNLELNRQRLELSKVSFESLTRELEIEEAKLKSNLEKLELNKEILIRRAEQLKKPLVSPIEGVITTIDVEEGSNAFSGQRLLAISPKGNSVIKVEVPMYQASNIKKDQKASIRSSSANGELYYSGVVSRVSNVVRDSNFGGKDDKVIEVEVIVSEENKLMPGFLTDVEINSETSRDVTTVASFSVLEENGKTYVYIVDENIVRKVEVQIGMKTATDYEVIDLPIGTEVVVNPFKVRTGEKVKAVI